MAIPLNLNFNLNSQVPLDNRIVVQNIVERNALQTQNRTYHGMIVYVTDLNNYFYYDNNNQWAELNFGALKFKYINATQTLEANTKYAVDTSLNSFTVLLPPSLNNLNIGDVVEIIDISRTFDFNNLIINPSGEDLEGQDLEFLTCNVKGAHFLLIWTSNGWKLSIIDNNFSKAGVLKDSNVLPLLYLNIQENNNAELFDSNDVSNYKIPWNNIEYINNEYVSVSSIIDNSKYITYNPITKNLYIKEPGIYNVDLRYSSYNLRDASDFLRARLRSWDTEIPGGLTQENPILDVGLDVDNNVLPYSAQRPRVLSAFAQGPIGTTFNGEAMCAGFTTFKIITPQYVTADFLHVGALRVIPGQTDQSWGYPVYLGPYGNLPFMFISKIV